MSRRYSSEGSLFIGRLNKNCRVRDLEDVFEPYGKLSRCEIKYGIGNSSSFLAIYDIMYLSGYIAAIIDFVFSSIIMSPLIISWNDKMADFVFSGAEMGKNCLFNFFDSI